MESRKEDERRGGREREEEETKRNGLDEKYKGWREQKREGGG